MFQTQEILLQNHLEVTVPLVILYLTANGGPSQADIEWAQGFGDELAYKGDLIFFKGKKKGESAEMINKLVRAVAIASFFPGGIKLFGLRFESQPSIGPLEEKAQQC